MIILIYILMLFVPVQAQTNLHSYDVKNIDAPFKIFFTGRIEKILDKEMKIDSVFEIDIDSNYVETIDIDIVNKNIIDEFEQMGVFLRNKKLRLRFKWVLNDSTNCYYFHNNIWQVQHQGFLVLYVNDKITSILRVNGNLYDPKISLHLSTIVYNANNIITRKISSKNSQLEIKRYQIINGKFVEKKK